MLRFASTITSEYNEELEELMFFNPRQESMQGAIITSVEKYGLPSIHNSNGQLSIKTEKLSEVQTLFAFEEELLIGVMIYSRITPEQLTVIHIAINENYAADGQFANQMFMMRLLELLRKNARRIKGINGLQIINSHNNVLNYRV